jgi:fructokinase
MNNHIIRIGVDIGGSKIEIIALDSAGSELVRRRVPAPQGDYIATLECVAELVRQVQRDLALPVTIGIGTPGAVSASTGRIKNSNSTHLNGRALQDDLEARMGQNVRIANDADCFALSEAVDGAAAGARVVFGVILGTGVGGGVVVNGQLLVGANAITGEWGHNPMPDANAYGRTAPACYCGRAGCVETYLSGPGFARDYLRATGLVLDPPQIVSRALAGDAVCEAVLARYEERLARALAVVINILDPEVVVLGGGMSNIDRLYERVPKLWCAHVFSDSVVTRLERNRHGDSSGVRGAAWLWNDAAFELGIVQR